MQALGILDLNSQMNSSYTHTAQKRKRDEREDFMVSEGSRIFVVNMWQSQASASHATAVRWSVCERRDRSLKPIFRQEPWQRDEKALETPILQGQSWIVMAPYGAQVLPRHQILNDFNQLEDVTPDIHLRRNVFLAQGLCFLSFTEGYEDFDPTIDTTRCEVCVSHVFFTQCCTDSSFHADIDNS